MQANLTARDRLRAARVDPERCASASATSASDGLHALVARDYVAASVAIADAITAATLSDRRTAYARPEGMAGSGPGGLEAAQHAGGCGRVDAGTDAAGGVPV